MSISDGEKAVTHSTIPTKIIAYRGKKWKDIIQNVNKGCFWGRDYKWFVFSCLFLLFFSFQHWPSRHNYLSYEKISDKRVWGKIE